MNHPRSTLVKMYQDRAARCSQAAIEWRTFYLGTRFGRFIYKREWATAKIKEYQTLSEIYALTARMLAGID